MPTGLRIDGSHGVTQIDETYRNLVFIKKTRVTLPKRATRTFTLSGVEVTIADINLNQSYTKESSSNVVAFRNVTPFSLSDNTFVVQYERGTFTDFYNLSSSVDIVIDIYEFGLPPYFDSKFGLQVLDADGNIVFDTGYKPMRVVGMKANIPNANNSSIIPSKQGRLVAVSQFIVRQEFVSAEIYTPPGVTVVCENSKMTGYIVIPDATHGEDWFVAHDVNIKYLVGVGELTPTPGDSQLADMAMFIDVTGY